MITQTVVLPENGIKLFSLYVNVSMQTKDSTFSDAYNESFTDGFVVFSNSDFSAYQPAVSNVIPAEFTTSVLIDKMRFLRTKTVMNAGEFSFTGPPLTFPVHHELKDGVNYLGNPYSIPLSIQTWVPSRQGSWQPGDAIVINTEVCTWSDGMPPFIPNGWTTNCPSVNPGDGIRIISGSYVGLATFQEIAASSSGRRLNSETPPAAGITPHVHHWNSNTMPNMFNHLTNQIHPLSHGRQLNFDTLSAWPLPSPESILYETYYGAFTYLRVDNVIPTTGCVVLVIRSQHFSNHWTYNYYIS